MFQLAKCARHFLNVYSEEHQVFLDKLQSYLQLRYGIPAISPSSHQPRIRVEPTLRMTRVVHLTSNEVESHSEAARYGAMQKPPKTTASEKHCSI